METFHEPTPQPTLDEIEVDRPATPEERHEHLPLTPRSYYEHHDEAYLDALEGLVAAALSFGQTHAVDHPAATASPYNPAQETWEAQEREFDLEQLKEEALRFHEEHRSSLTFPSLRQPQSLSAIPDAGFQAAASDWLVPAALDILSDAGAVHRIVGEVLERELEKIRWKIERWPRSYLMTPLEDRILSDWFLSHPDESP